jgi:ubiquinone/menaquinone biosynthesis C-methylase UbiE
MEPRSEVRRRGDTIDIDGGYQYRALTEGFVVQRFWHRLKQTTIERVAPPGSDWDVLDVGCGSGVVSAFLASRAREVHAVDSNRSAVEFARKTFPLENLHFHLGVADEIEFADEQFDGIYLLELIEHLYWEQVTHLLGRLKRFLKPSGVIFLTTPNYRSAWPVLEEAVDCLGLVPRMDGEQHVSRATKRRLSELASRCGFEEIASGKFSGLAPFVSVVGWRVAEKLDAVEARWGCPFGNLLYALWRKA